MDTDNLSTEAYKAIIFEADKFNRDLTNQFGVMAGSCKSEKEYLIKSKNLITAIQGLKEYQLSDIFFGPLPDKKHLHSTLQQILTNISAVEKIPEDKRHYEF